MKLQTDRILLILFMLFVYGVAFGAEKHNVKPADGYVPHKEVAIKIALAVWEPIYGQKQIASEAPFNAILKDDVWYVTGSLPEGWAGGVALIEIDKETGEILRVSHGK